MIWWGLFTQQICGWLEGQLPGCETSVAQWAPQCPHPETLATLPFEPEWVDKGQGTLECSRQVRRHHTLIVSSLANPDSLHRVSQLHLPLSKLGAEGPHFPFKPEFGFKGRKETM